MSDTFCTGILLRKTQALENVPLTRITLLSPYPLYTRNQLDMRRKIEILKYTNNSSGSKTNNFTKKEMWSRLSNQYSTQKKTTAQINNDEVEKLCDLKPTLTTSCDVPGPPMILQYDPTIPLYNYTNRVLDGG